MLRGILVGIEDSAYGEAAVNLGIAWAKRFTAQLVALGVVDTHAIEAPEGLPIGGSALKKRLNESRQVECEQRVEKLLSHFSLKCIAAGIPSKELEDTGWPHEEILRELQRYDLLITGLKGRFYTRDEQPTSTVLHEVLHHTSRPVVAVPEVASAQGQGVLIAYDGSLQAARTVQAFLFSGLAELGPVHILSLHRDSQVEAAKTADRAAEFLSSHQLHVKSRGLQSDAAPGAIILDQAHQLGVEMIVMGCYGKTRLHEFFLGSGTRYLLEQADLPLFLYH